MQHFIHILLAAISYHLHRIWDKWLLFLCKCTKEQEQVCVWERVTIISKFLLLYESKLHERGWMNIISKNIHSARRETFKILFIYKKRLLNLKTFLRIFVCILFYIGKRNRRISTYLKKWIEWGNILKMQIKKLDEFNLPEWE